LLEIPAPQPKDICCLPRLGHHAVGTLRPSFGQQRHQLRPDPVFLTNDLELPTKLKAYLSRKAGRHVQLVRRRTYEEITNLLLSGELAAAWICGYPLAQHTDELSLVAVPLWDGKPLYRS